MPISAKNSSVFWLFIALVVVLFGRSIYLQIAHGDTFAALAQGNKGRVTYIESERGIIYDKSGKKLVTNAPAYDLLCDKKAFSGASPSSQKQLGIISQVTGTGLADIATTISTSSDNQSLVIQNIGQQSLLVLEAKINDLPDCQIQKNTVRDYAFGPAFSHVLGYNGKVTKEDVQGASDYSSNDYIGKLGLEKYYEVSLRGIPGKMLDEKNAVGESKSEKILSEPVSGDNLVLNIDADLQKTAYDALAKSIKNIGAKRGAAIALDPRNGQVLALVSYPAYDNNIFSKSISQADYNAIINDPNQPFFNRAIAAKYPTGSTIKPFEASGALQENLIDPNKLINDPGYIIVHSQNDPTITYKFAGVVPHGLVDMRKAIAVSSNIYFYTVGGGYGDQQGLGPARIKKYLDAYGWEQKTGIDLPGEFKGFVPTPTWKKETKKENWWDGDTYNLSIGQSDLQVTPLQVAVAYAAIANGGTLYQPQIVNKITDTSSGTPVTVQQFTPQVMGKVGIDQKNLDVVKEGMHDGVTKDYGGSHMLNDIGADIAGKTGTAETGKNGIYNTWSSDFAPYNNPEIVFVTTIEGVEGLRAATLPVAYDVLKWYFDRDKGVEPVTSNP